MRTMGIREFRAALSTSLSEPIQVLGRGAEVGVYYPAKDDTIAGELGRLQEEVARLKRELAARRGPMSTDRKRLRAASPPPSPRRHSWGGAQYLPDLLGDEQRALEAALSKPIRVEVPFGVPRPAPKPGKTK